MMEQIIKNPMYTKYFSDKSPIAQSNNRCNSSIWIHIICSVLKSNKVLDSLGYNLSNSEKFHNPTTLSRLILTYLCNRKLGCMRDELGFTTLEVSLKELIETLEKIPFGTFSKGDSWQDDVIPSLEKNYKESNNHEIIILTISKMLQRNNSTEEIELWRRPIYHTHNAFSLSDINFIKNEMLNQIKHFGEENSPVTSFCITDEGYTFIEKIATHFEFYSVRYNNCATEPICCVLDRDKLDRLIKRVYNEVETCTKKQIWLMDFYMKRQNVSENEYLNEWFHPRTDRFKTQLHIVRTIYDHINYLNDYREYLYEIYGNNLIKFMPLNYCLVKWIGNYLELYRNYLFTKLKNTIENYNNNVWLDLKYLYWLVQKDDTKKGVSFVAGKENNFITINRLKSTISRTKQNNKEYSADYKITDERLLNEPMLLE